MSALAALARRDFLITRSYRLPFVADLSWGVIDLVLYYFTSKVVGPVAPDELQGAPSYFAFALAGIIGSLIVESASGDIGGRIRSEQLTGTLELLCAQPVRDGNLAIGYAAFPLMFAVARVSVYLVIAFTVLGLTTDSTDWLGVAVILLTSAGAFLGLGIIAAAVTVVFKQGDMVVEAAVFAMTFVSGALFPLSVLPDWLEPIGRLMPTSYTFEGLRDALFTGEGWGTAALVLVGWTVVLVPVSIWVFSRALRHAKRAGTLAEY